MGQKPEREEEGERARARERNALTLTRLLVKNGRREGGRGRRREEGRWKMEWL